MKDYYSILEVRRNASIDEIKRSFRRLANLYHPDRNPSAEAEAIIKDVIEAYQVLEDPIQRSLYDGLLRKDEPDTAPTSRTGKPHRDPRYRSRPRNPAYKSEKQQNLELMQAYMPWSLLFSRITLVVCVVLSFDFTLPPKTEKETIRGMKMSVIRGYSDTRIVTQHGNEFVVSPAEASRFSGGSSITISYSPWMKVPLYMMRDDAPGRTHIPATIYGNFIFIPIVLIITSLLGVFWTKGILFRFNLGIVNGLLLILTIVFLLIHHLKLS